MQKERHAQALKDLQQQARQQQAAPEVGAATVGAGSEVVASDASAAPAGGAKGGHIWTTEEDTYLKHLATTVHMSYKGGVKVKSNVRWGLIKKEMIKRFGNNFGRGKHDLRDRYRFLNGQVVSSGSTGNTPDTPLSS